MRLRFLLAALVMGASITAGCGVLLDLSHLDDGAGGAGTGSSSGAGGMDIATSSGSSGVVASAATTTSAASAASSSAGTGGGASSSSSSGSSSGTGGVVGPPPIEIDAMVDGGTLHFKIDSTEVTVAQYAAFVKGFEAEAPIDQKQHPVCGWNHSVRPNTATANDAGPTMSAPECDSFDLDTEAAVHPDTPIRCIDWCDAAAYCLWAGGYLCRSNEGDMSHPTEWKTACGGTTNLKFPYGPTYQANTCVDSSVMNKPAVVASHPLCEGGYKGIFDMSGNVSEWLDCGCEYEGTDPTTTNAYIGGGAYHATGDDLDCTPNNTSPIGGFRKDVGARCCYTP